MSNITLNKFLNLHDKVDEYFGNFISLNHF